MLKKDRPPWGPEQTQAVQEIKKIAQNPPALKILGDGKRILQTDASDHYWGAVFIEEVQGKKFYCGHASGQFKEAEKHYHTTYKEVLIVKNGIKKFDFHLRGHHFEVQMDNSSFPKIMDFKNKLPPEPQILRLKDWFSRYDFTVKHIKRKHNLIPYFLSRPQNPVLVTSSSHSFPLIFMVKPLSDTTKTRKLYPPGFKPRSLEEIIRFAKAHYFYYLHETLRFKIVPPSMFDPTEEHPEIFELFCEIGWDLCEPTLWVIWCKTVQHPIPIPLRTQSTYDILTNPDKADYLFWTLLEWFLPLTWWRRELKKVLNFQRNQKGNTREQCEFLTSIAIISRPYFQSPTGQLWSKNEAYFWGTFETYPLDQSYRNQLINHLKETRIHQKSQDEASSSYSCLIPSQSSHQGIKTFMSWTEYFVPNEQFQTANDLGEYDEDLYYVELMMNNCSDSDTSDLNLSSSHEPIIKGG